MKFLDTHLTYCMNIFPGESPQQLIANLDGDCRALREQLCPNETMAVGLRLGAEAAAYFDQPGKLSELKLALKRNNLYSMTVNAFPYGQFHQVPVKENVYYPDWGSVKRIEYSMQCARILANLLPEGVSSGSISTVPVTYGKFKPKGMWECIEQCLRELSLLEQETEKRIILAFEPEPDCYLERTADALTFMRELRKKLPQELHVYAGICLDTCHAALQFECPLQALREMRAEGISVPKIQLSSALDLKVEDRRRARELMQPFAEEVYLHQTRVLDKSGLLSVYSDLPKALKKGIEGHWRSHFHVPLHWHGEDELGSTSHLITKEFLQEAAEAGCHLEVETYTFFVLPGHDGNVLNSLRKEMEFVLQQVKA